ncbi:MAG: CmcJ/NvfI family oxidoreductase, partial [Stellaceae bacterium]
MAQLAELGTERETLDATLDYFVDTKATPVTIVADPGASDRRTGGGASEQHRITIRNGRLRTAEFALEKNGFRFVHHDTRVTDFYDEDEIRRVYYPEMEALIKAEAGARRVVVFDHTLRTADQALRETAKIRDPVRRVHNDYTEWSGPQRVRDLMGDEAEALLARRFAIVQVWRPIRHPVESWPLAIADARSLAPDDMVVTERHYPNRIGQTSAITWNPDHRWYWFPQMRPDEALVFK